MTGIATDFCWVRRGQVYTEVVSWETTEESFRFLYTSHLEIVFSGMRGAQRFAHVRWGMVFRINGCHIVFQDDGPIELRIDGDERTD